VASRLIEKRHDSTQVAPSHVGPHVRRRRKPPSTSGALRFSMSRPQAPVRQIR
jgi:hypothetical protein